MPGTDYPPLNDTHVSVGNYAAVPGEDLQVYGPGQVALIELAGTVACGQRITPNYTSTSASDGRGVAVGAYNAPPAAIRRLRPAKRRVGEQDPHVCAAGRLLKAVSREL